MHIVARRLQIARRRTVHDQRLVAAAEQMAEQLVAAVEPARVSAQKPFHARNQVGMGRFEHQVKMIRHEAIGMNLPARLAAHTSPKVSINRWRSSLSWKIDSRRSPRFITWYTAPGTESEVCAPYPRQNPVRQSRCQAAIDE